MPCLKPAAGPRSRDYRHAVKNRILLPANGQSSGIVNFCSECGERVETRVPEGDSRPRDVCPACGTIHYENPRIVAGCVVTYGDEVLLCKRAIEPRSGFWTVPAGFMELGETMAEAAARETLEEACARIEPGALFSIVDVVHARQVHVFFEAALETLEFGAGEETEAAAMYPLDAIPWKELAFPSVRIALQRYLENRAAGVTALHLDTAPRIRVS